MERVKEQEQCHVAASPRDRACYDDPNDPACGEGNENVRPLGVTQESFINSAGQLIIPQATAMLQSTRKGYNIYQKGVGVI